MSMRRMMWTPGLDVGSPLGVPLLVHPLTPVVGALLSWGYAGVFAPHLPPGSPPWVAIALGVSCYALFVASLLAHEYGHVLTARHLGLGTRHVSVTPFGCVAALDEEPRGASEEALITAAGPFVSIALALVALSAAWFLHDGIPGLVAYVLGMINAGIAAFNLIPCFPTDGGRLVRALAWAWTGDQYRATRAARYVGWFGAAAMAAVGILAAVTGSPLGLLAIVMAAMMTAYAAREVRRLAPTDTAAAPARPVARDAMLPFGARTDGLGVYVLPAGHPGAPVADLVATMGGKTIGRWPASTFASVAPGCTVEEAVAAAAAPNASGVPVALVFDGKLLGYVVGKT